MAELLLAAGADSSLRNKVRRADTFSPPACDCSAATVYACPAAAAALRLQAGKLAFELCGEAMRSRLQVVSPSAIHARMQAVLSVPR